MENVWLVSFELDPQSFDAGLFHNNFTNDPSKFYFFLVVTRFLKIVNNFKRSVMPL